MVWIDHIEEELSPLLIYPAAGGFNFQGFSEVIIRDVDGLFHDGFDLLSLHMAEVMH